MRAARRACRGGRSALVLKTRYIYEQRNAKHFIFQTGSVRIDALAVAAWLLVVGSSLSASCSLFRGRLEDLSVVRLGAGRPYSRGEVVTVAVENQGSKPSRRYRGCSVSFWEAVEGKENRWRIHRCYREAGGNGRQALCGPDRPSGERRMGVPCPTVIEPAQRFAWELRVDSRLAPGSYMPVVTLWHADRSEADIIEGELFQAN